MAAAPHAPCTRRHALLIAAGMAVASVARARARLPVRHTVVMAATAYAPLTLTVRRGDSVEWINKDPFPHTVTCAGVFDSQSIAEGARWTYRADRRDRFAYTCTFHPNMNGTLVVT